MHPSECPSYDQCKSPLCPLDPNPGHIWYPDEEVCHMRNPPGWVRKQRKIARLPQIDPDRYFTIPMLQAIRRVGRGLRGANAEVLSTDKGWLARRQPGQVYGTSTPDISRLPEKLTEIQEDLRQLEQMSLFR